MNEFMDAIYDKLAGTAAVTTLLATTTNIFETEAPRSAAFPYVVYFLHGGIGDELSNPDRHINILITIKAVSATSIASAGAIASAVDTALHNQSLTVTGWTVIQCARDWPVRYTEHGIDGREIYHAGGIYRLRAGT